MHEIHTGRVVPNSRLLKKAARVAKKKLTESGLLVGSSSKPKITPKETLEVSPRGISMVCPRPVPRTPQYVAMPIGVEALFIPWAHEDITFSARKFCNTIAAYPVQLTSTLTKINNYQSVFLNSTKTLRAPAGCFVFPSKLTPALTSMIDSFIAEGESTIEQILKEAYSTRDGRCAIPGEGAIFVPRSSADVADVLDVCMPNRVYLVSITGPQAGNKVPCKIEHMVGDSIKERLFKAPLDTLTLTIDKIKLSDSMAAVKACEIATMERITTYLCDPPEYLLLDPSTPDPEPEDAPDAPDEAPDQTDAVGEEVLDAPEEEFIDAPDAPGDDSGEVFDDGSSGDFEGPGDREDPPSFMDPHTENAYLRAQVALYKKITEQQTEIYQLTKRVNNANTVRAVVASFMKVMEDLLRDTTE